MKSKIRIVTNAEGTGDYVVVYVDGVVGREGNTISLYDWQEILTFIGVDVKLIHLNDEDFDNPLFDFESM